MTTEFLEPGEFSFDESSRILRGMLLPFGETSRPSQTGHVSTFEAEDIVLPRDISIVGLNRKHNFQDMVGRAIKLEKQEKGLYAEFQLADTEEADNWLSKEKTSLRKLSPEVLFAEDKKRARVTGAALVTEGAFATAGLFALAETELPEEDTELVVQEETTPETPKTTPSEEIQREELVDMTNSIVPDGAVTPEDNKVDQSASALFSALATNANSGDRSVMAPFAQIDSANTGLFALSDITATGAAAALQTQFVGDLWARKQYQNRIVPLLGHENLTSLKVEGWRWTTPPVVAAYAGDKAEVPSGSVAFGTTTVAAERIAGAHDVDRALRDFGNESFWSGYFRAMTESYAKVADAKVLARLIAAPNANNGIGATVVTPGTVPSGVDAGVAALVDGALAVVAAGYTPTFALVSSAIYRTMLLTKKDQVLEFLTSAIGLEEGALGGFRIVPVSTLAAGRVIVGSKSAATVYELPGSPIRVEGLDIAKGGIDPAVFGYIATVVNDIAGLASVTTA